MSEPVLLSAARTPFGAIMGALSGLDAPSLGALAVSEALRRAGIRPGQVGRVLLGNVSSHAQNGNPAAAAWARAGHEPAPVCLTVRAGCASGLASVALALESIASGACDVAVAGGFESSSTAPHLALGLRRGLRLGGATLLDAARHDGPAAIPVGGEKHEGVFDRARDGGLFTEEIFPAEIPGRRGAQPARIERDEGARHAGPDGKPPLADGAAAVVLASREWAEREGIPFAARLSRASAPLGSLAAGCRLVEADLDGALATALGLDDGAHRAVNVSGGGAQIGHAPGADGARLLVSLVHALRREGGGRGMACASGSWGESAVVMADV